MLTTPCPTTDAKKDATLSGRVPLLYHELCDQPGAYLYAMAHIQFEQHLRALSLLPAAFRSPQFTFDDGHRSDYERALPSLKAAGAGAIFFITTGWTDKRAGFMRRSELQQLHAAGMSLGAHGVSHTLLTHCARHQLRQELEGSRAFLEDTLGAPVTQMSLPGGRSNAGVLRAAEEAGFKHVWTSMPGVVEPNTRLLPRFNVRSNFPTESLQTLMDPESTMLSRLRRTQQIKSMAQKLLGDRIYAGVWSLMNGKQTFENDAFPAEEEAQR